MYFNCFLSGIYALKYQCTAFTRDTAKNLKQKCKLKHIEVRFMNINLPSFRKFCFVFNFRN